MLLPWLWVLTVACEEVTQQLVFGKDGGDDCCDVKLLPTQDVSLVTILLKTEGEDAAVPKGVVTPETSNKNGYFKVIIPDDIERDESLYSFQFTTSSGDDIFSENWTYDPDKRQFALASAVKRPFYRKKSFQYGAGATAACGAACGLVYYLKSSRRKKAVM